jgi:hypothetical protein
MAFNPAVWSAFRSTLGNEGYTDYMYLDDKGLVTTGQGNLIDTGGATPWELALPMSWVDPSTGKESTDEEIIQQWQAVKARQDLKEAGGGAFENVTTIRLNAQSITDIVTEHMNSTIASLESQFPAIGSWPADAQLAMLRWSWAFGPNHFTPSAGRNYYPLMTAALKKVSPDFEEAANQASLNDLNLSVQTDIRQMFQNATDVLDRNLDTEVLYFPNYPPGSGSGSSKGFFIPAVAVAAGAGLSYLAFEGFKDFFTKQKFPRKV